MTFKLLSVAATSLLAIVALSGCDSDDDDTSIPVSSINWTDCDIDNLECATLMVPMDYQSPDGEEIEMAINRHPASGTRIGSLLFNPGGPGGSGKSLVQEFIEYEALPEAILSSYDIIGFDPRGLGDSTPIDCDEFGVDDFDAYPIDDDSVQALYDDHVAFAAACSNKYGAYLQQLGSMNVVRDMEEIRKALGDSELNFIGYSYGTRLAALYLQAFPATSGRIVLDGSLLPDSTMLPLLTGQLDPLENNLRNALAICSSIDSECNVNDLVNQLNSRVVDLVSTDTEESLQELEIVGNIVITTAEDPEFAAFSAAPLVNYITTGELSAFSEFFLLLEQLEGPEDEEQEEDEGSTSAPIAILCADDATRLSVAELISSGRDFNQRSDLFAEAQIAQLAACSGWPEALEQLPPIATDVAPTSLVIGGTSDAQTPLSWSETMALAIGGIFIKSEHLGHTSVFIDSSDCIDDLVETFLIDGTTPADTFCAAD